MFNTKQLEALQQELNSQRVKSRQKGQVNLSYLEGFDVIETANRIFGYGHWSYSVSTLEQVSQEQNSNQNVVIGYKAIISMTIHNTEHTQTIQREDVGFGTGIAKSLADAHEGAAKEAVTDALKRTLRSFGNQFGNSLYDKSRQYHQSHNQTIPKPNTTTDPRQSHTQPPQDYTTLYNLGLTLIEQGSNLIVVGDDIFAKKATIKACGFRWDSGSKLWYKPIEQQGA
jgi:DNA repair and recombination protein RAD52